MYACLHVPASQAAIPVANLQQVALRFSPLVETASANTVMFCITPLRRLIGSPHQIASEICRYGNEQNVGANLAIASNPDAAALLARHYTGVTLVTPGEEHFQIAPIPLVKLFSHDLPVDPALLDVLLRWGLKTCEDLAALPEKGIAERLGAAGIYLRNLATGRINRPLRVPAEETNYEKRMEPEYPITLLEPLLFLFGSALTELCGRLRSQSRSARLLQVKLELSRPAQSEESASPAPAPTIPGTYECALEFPVPVDQASVMLKLLQLHLERHPPSGAVTSFMLRVDPVEPQRLQGGLFLPATPQADKLHVTLKRIEGMVGEGNVGVPELLNTHRPDSFRMSMHLADVNPAGLDSTGKAGAETPVPATLRLALRLFRPALHARVRLADLAPKQVVAPGVQGSVVESAGPWKTSGDWWTLTPWVREEWDVALDDGALYRIYCELKTREWYVHAVYD
jgi:protein ImuB